MMTLCSQVIGCEDRLQNGLYCVGWGVKLYSIQSYIACNIMFTVVCLCHVIHQHVTLLTKPCHTMHALLG